MTGRLAGARALITGGARGMGAAQARRFVAEGAEVVIADLREEDGRALATALGPAASFVRLDVTDEGAWAALCADLGARGGIDVLVHNAAIYWRKSLVDTTPADYRAMSEVNQIGALLALQAAAALMTERGGSVVLMSSVAGLRGSVDHGAYCAGKWAVTGLARTAALEFAPRGIRVNAVHPGLIETPLVADHFADGGFAAYTATQPVNRPGTPEDVAGMVLFLASAEAAYCTGGSYLVDGGTMTGSRAVP